MTNYWLRRDQLSEQNDLSARGFMYQGQVSATLAAGETASAALVTGNTPTLIYLREITSTDAPLTFSLYEVDSISGLSGSVRGQNVNRLIGGSASASEAVMWASASAATPTALLASDVVGGFGGKSICQKLRTLAPSTTYLMQWWSNGHQGGGGGGGPATTIGQVTILWSERVEHVP